MGLMKLILLIVVGYAGYWVYRRVRAQLGQDAKAPVLEAEEMVRCAHCSVHVPRAGALQHRGHWYCCEEHRSLHTGS
jgi:uncharacterized protein